MSMIPGEHEFVLRHGHLFCGVGGGAMGFNEAQPRVRNVRGRWECAGGFDVDAGAMAEFARRTGTKGRVLDFFSLEQYLAFHGKPPPPGWTEAMPEDVREHLGKLDCVFLSAPCKGFSGLLSTKQSLTDKYQALNGLTLRGVWLLCEAYKDDPVPVILFENVPRIQNRGRHLLDQIIAILRSYGYICNEDTHDCGELGGLAQSRNRFLLIARHPAKVPPFIYQPPKMKLRGVGEVIGKLPLPGDPVGGVMHRVPALQWKTWVRLAFVPAGRDWRALNELAVENGMLRDFGIVPEQPLRENALGVCRWEDTAPLITGQRSPGQGRFSVADPRIETTREGSGRLGVREWSEPSGTVQGCSRPENGAFSVADPRPGYGPDTHRNVLGVKQWDQPAGVVNGNMKPSGGAHAVADPRPPAGSNQGYQQYGVTGWDENTVAVSGQSAPGGGPYSVADPRPGYPDSTHQNILAVTGFDAAAKTVSGAKHVAGGALSVADPRVDGHPKSVQLGVRGWDEPTGVVKGKMDAGQGPYSIADPRLHGRPRFNNVFRIVSYSATAPAVAGPGGPAGGLAVADPRPEGKANYETTKYKVTRYEDPARAVIGASTTGDGAFAVADPRCTWGANSHRNKLKVVAEEDPAPTVTGANRVGSGAPSVASRRPHYQTGGHYGVVPWQDPAGTVSASACHDNGFNSVADPREVELSDEIGHLPAPNDRLVCRIIAQDETWHRPFTTLELGSLQSLIDPEAVFYQDQDGAWHARDEFEILASSDATKREWIGNMVPPKSAKAIATTIGEALILARLGETFTLSSAEIWVKPGALALAIDNDQVAFDMDGGRP